MTQRHTLATMGFSQLEVTLLQTIIRLSSEPAITLWELVTTDIQSLPYIDALLVHAKEIVSPQVLTKTNYVVFVGHPTSPPSRTFETIDPPIHADAIINWMVRHTKIQPVQQETSPAAQAVSPEQGTPPIDSIDFSSTTVKLAHWPPMALLQKNATRVRMAAALSKRALTSQMLADISGQSKTVAEQFMLDLFSAGLLQLQAASAVATSTAGGETSAVHVENTAPPAVADNSATVQVASILEQALAARTTLHNSDTPKSADTDKPTRPFFQILRQRFGL